MDFAEPPANDSEAARAQLISLAIHSKVPLTSLDPTCKWTTDKDAAAVEALNRTPALAKTELGGVLFKNENNEYCYSIPVGNGKAAHFQFQANIPQGLKLDGIYHTHPEGKWSSKFSEDDIAMAKQLHVQSYIKDLATGNVKRLEPTYRGLTTEGTPVEPRT